MNVKIRYIDLPVITTTTEEKPVEKEFTLKKYANVKVRILNKGEGCEFFFRNFDLEDIATIRKIFFSSLETMAIELIEIEENISDLPDEIIAHRLGLLPIKCENDENLSLVDDCEGCPEDETPPIEKCKHCGIEFKLEKSLPKSSKTKRIKVTEKDIKFEDNRCKIQSSGTLIMALRPGQKISIKGLAMKGTGKMNAKWSPVAAVRYKRPGKNLYVLEIETTGQMDCEEIITRALNILKSK